jgi:hypothetical protein
MKEKLDYLNETLTVELDKYNRPYLKVKDPKDNKTATDFILGGIPWVLTQKFGACNSHYEIASVWCKTKIKLIKIQSHEQTI